ncbi:hypothetical protein [Myxococcus sp. CA040A]|uniref:hypothetical protein n=1 Tax=Myxococcus sp. CA040A TaxID=2741738 RepID=UPI00157BA372|nr:hypothetical protein [Myxococcus sp. CA040A]NTX02672.1 hypothetical protein [Myxococcus sp. CA040A]
MRQCLSRFESRPSFLRELTAWGLPALLSVTIGCGPAGMGDGEPNESTGTHEEGLVSTNGLSTNGLSTNGLSTNGLSTNGLSTNGLSTNGLSTNGVFNTWFSANPAQAEMLMKYVARCALSPTQTLSYTHGGTTYSWPGSLGLAPSWTGSVAGSQPQPASVTEQQVVSACLAAHANKFGVHVNISVLGKGASNVAIPSTPEELQLFSKPEACFFGNLFANEGLFAANDTSYLSYDESTVRTCGLSSWSGDAACAPAIAHVGNCLDHCQADPLRGGFYKSCTYNGKPYRPISTRIRPQDIYRCGDGVCQISEQCGTGTAANNCASDCGACP